jgi:FkbM family methyltransferase
MYYLKTRSLGTDTPIYQKLEGGDDTFFFPEARVAKDYAMTGLYEQSIIQWACDTFVHPGKDVLDIGAHCGIYTVEMAKKTHVHAFECSPRSFTYLCANLALRNIQSNVTPYRVALGNAVGRASYYVRDPKDGGGNGIIPFDYDRQRSTPTISVPMATLDSFELSNIGFIKLDVEGAEQQVLEGGVETLRRNGYPKILFESWRPAQETLGFSAIALRTSLFAFLESLGYHIVPVQGWDEMFLAEHV